MNTSWDTEKNHTLVLAIVDQRHHASLSLLCSIAKIALAGGFAGCRSHDRWRCGSWLDQRVREAISQSEQQAGVSFADVLAQEGHDATLEAWEDVVRSDLILPFGTYRTHAQMTFPLGPPLWRQAAERLHAEWKWRARSSKPRPRFDHGPSLEERFQTYLAHPSYRRNPGLFLGVRPSEQDANALATWILALEEPVRAGVLAGMHRNRRTWWRQFRRRLMALNSAG